MPAHKYSKRNKKRPNFKIFLIIFLLIVISCGLFSLLRKRSWVGDSKLGLVINSSDKIYLAIFDPVVKDITTIEIPTSVEVEVSRDLGKWKIGSVWKLGQDEKLEGKLLTETILKNFKIPVVYWADTPALAFINKGNIFKATFSSYKTNLTFPDKLRILAFSLTVKEFKKNQIDLSQTTYLKKKKLADGEMGYIITEVIPKNVVIAAADNLIAKSDLKILLINASGTAPISDKLGQIIQAMGTKITAIKNVNEENINCSIFGKNKKLVKRFALIFSCEESKETLSDNFDIVIKFGSVFKQRF